MTAEPVEMHCTLCRQTYQVAVLDADDSYLVYGIGPDGSEDVLLQVTSAGPFCLVPTCAQDLAIEVVGWPIANGKLK